MIGSLPPLFLLLAIGVVAYLLKRGVVDPAVAVWEDSWAAPVEVIDGGGFLEVPRVNALPGPHNEFDNQVRYAAALYGMTDPAAPIFLKAVIQQESGWNARARGDYDPARCPEPYRGDAFYTGYCAIGLMQVHRYWQPALASSYDLRDPDQNILAGAQVLAAAYQRWWPDWRRVYAQYNAGAGAATAWPAVSAQVTAHVEAVGAIYRQLAAAGGVSIA